ncbi:ThyX-like thymidylate synthase [Mycobacterium phage Archetta]|uniref:ThyX-like thymidylate synthase n=1 Tax=Mycobacterium phage Archetta TaxID=2047836 RepID=A0A2H4PF97_9CAUD|nr:thymidylate synthase [Mycobacterium phage Archetta]ATW60014.1 ThyX-like thymidylate synthase [Mycobacterium phage Phlorence]ATW60912.1 ThyX-like thymidylate synthase [Mycobacterium phage Archetta]ATW60986.1 ThyX-like thymidylate synthase [Mycobacterium phage Aragog]WNM67856.1 ThyX-like thymidylate synthase [Mycobacterium phage Discoknowium]
MKAALVAYTIVNDEAILSSAGYRTRWLDERAENWERDADELAEFAGRNCYRSFDRPNPATRENKDYLAHILEVGHESVLEHASATFYIEASRSVLTELERHRHLSFSVVSQRYVDPTELGVHVPPAIQECMGEIPGEILRDAVEYAVGSYEAIVSYLSGVRGLPRKQAREAARAVLPNMTNSPMVVTGNHRAWRNVIKQRWHKAADAEIRELAGMLLQELRKIAPNTYQDIPEEPYG